MPNGKKLSKELSFPVVISATSAAGKDSFLKILLADLPFVGVVPRLTTRNRRNGEAESLQYQFISKDRIYSEYRQGNLLFLEENYGGRLYGVRRKEVDDLLSKGKIPILIANTREGTEQILHRYRDGLFIFIAPFGEEINLGLSSTQFFRHGFSHFFSVLNR